MWKHAWGEVCALTSMYPLVLKDVRMECIRSRIIPSADVVLLLLAQARMAQRDAPEAFARLPEEIRVTSRPRVRRTARPIRKEQRKVDTTVGVLERALV